MVIIPSGVSATGAAFGQEALESAAGRLRDSGKTTIRDMSDNLRSATVTDVLVTERGVEATVHYDAAVPG